MVWSNLGWLDPGARNIYVYHLPYNPKLTFNSTVVAIMAKDIHPEAFGHVPKRYAHELNNNYFVLL